MRRTGTRALPVAPSGWSRGLTRISGAAWDWARGRIRRPIGVLAVSRWDATNRNAGITSRAIGLVRWLDADQWGGVGLGARADPSAHRRPGREQVGCDEQERGHYQSRHRAGQVA